MQEHGVGAGQEARYERCLNGSQMRAEQHMDGSPVQFLPTEKVDEVITSCAR